VIEIGCHTIAADSTSVKIGGRSLIEVTDLQTGFMSQSRRLPVSPLQVRQFGPRAITYSAISRLPTCEAAPRVFRIHSMHCAVLRDMSFRRTTCLEGELFNEGRILIKVAVANPPRPDHEIRDAGPA
jgi:hypothetical protein